MIITNALLSISLSLISNFVETAGLPYGVAPRGIADIKSYHFGFLSPIDAYIVLRNRNEFWIREGVVQGYLSPDSMHINQDPNPPRDLKASCLTSNQVVALANSLVERLARSPNPIALASAKISVSPGRGSTVPAFYYMVWPGTNGLGYAVALEIDARRAILTYLDLKDSVFFDRSFAAQISNRVYVADPLPKPYPVRQRERPTREQVEIGTRSWLKLCARLGYDPGAQTNLASVNWQETYVYTNPPRSTLVPVCFVCFNDGQVFQSLGGSVFSFAARDSCYVGAWGNQRKDHWERFQGKANFRLEDLTKKLETALVDKVGLPKSLLGLLKSNPVCASLGEPGSVGLRRALVQWDNQPKDETKEPSEFFSAEFDVETGELKLLDFWSPVICEALRQALAKPAPNEQFSH